MPTTFDRQTYKLQLPAFMYNTAGTPITLSDFYGEKRFGRGQHKDRYHSRAEFHMLYCKFPGLCKACDCSSTALCTCLSYGELWDKFLHDTGRSVPGKAQIPAALDAWKVWGQRADLSVQQQELCLGPELSVRVLTVQQAAMPGWHALGLRSPSLLTTVWCSPKAMASTGLDG